MAQQLVWMYMYGLSMDEERQWYVIIKYYTDARIELSRVKIKPLCSSASVPSNVENNIYTKVPTPN